MKHDFAAMLCGHTHSDDSKCRQCRTCGKWINARYKDEECPGDWKVNDSAVDPHTQG